MNTILDGAPTSLAKAALLKSLKSRTVLAPSGSKDLAESACDIVNALGMTDKNIALKCNLTPSTVRRVRELKRPYKPNALTIEKIYKAFDICIQLR